MFNKHLLLAEVQDFIHDNIKTEATKVALDKSPFPEVSSAELAEQLRGLQRAQRKLPSWSKRKGVIYPVQLSMEQCSSEATSKYKGQLFKGKRMCDLTGGLGIDTLSLAQNFEEAEHYELNTELSEIARHNFKTLGADNITCFNQNGLEKILDSDQGYDLIYLDPARRDDAQRKVFRIEDCTPDIGTHYKNLLEHCDTLLIKFSPMLDITVAIRSFPEVHAIHIVAVKDEVKELLVEISSADKSAPVSIKSCNLRDEGRQYFEGPWEESTLPPSGSLSNYLLDVNSAVRKAGLINAVASAQQLLKLNPKSLLLTSEDYPETFPGRVFKVLGQCKVSKKEIHNFLPEGKANLATRNFPVKVADLKKKLKIKDGGDLYVFATVSSENKNTLIVCKKE